MPPRDFTSAPTLDPVEDITRRQLLTALPALGLLATGINCGDDDDDDGSGDLVTIEDTFGTVTIPARPERVVASRHHHIGNMLALGVTPVGIMPSPSAFSLPGHAEALADATVIRTEDWELDLERVLALEPDLIIEMSGRPDNPWNQETCERAKAAVATVCFAYGYSTEEEIKQNLLDVGRVLGREAQAAGLVREYDERVAGLRERAKAFAGKPVANIQWNGEENARFWIPTDRTANLLMRTLGIPEPSFQNSADLGRFDYGYEDLYRLNEAYAVVVALEGNATREALEANPVWQLLEPVQADRVVFVDGRVWVWDYMPAIMQMLEDIETLLLPLAE